MEAWAGGTRLEVGPPRQRTVLAVLIAEAGRAVAVNTLVDRVWGQAPPAGARRSLQSHIARVRRLVEQLSVQCPSARLVRSSEGYQINLPTDLVDLHRFRALVQDARRDERRDAERAAVLAEALDLWRGEPFGGVPGDWAERVRHTLRRDHISAAVAWAQATLGIGDPDAVIRRLGELADEQPLVEPLLAWLIRALAAAGRTAEALDLYAASARRLADELGADPGPELRQAHQEALEATRGAGIPPDRRPRARSGAGYVVPAQLPCDVYGFAGRADQLAALDELLKRSVEQPTAVAVSVLSGAAGVGKTALAVHWAHQVADRFPDGQLYVDLRGFDPGGEAVAPGVAIRGFLDALGVPAGRISPDPDAQVALYRSLVNNKRVLVVLDNARSADQVQPLLPGTPTAAVVVTSRNQLTGVLAAGAQPLTVDVLAGHEARELLSRRLGPDRVAAEPGTVEEIIAGCARLPLALAVVAARTAQTGFPLSAIAAELTDAGDGPGALDAGELATRPRTVFSWSYAALTPPAARLFRLLGLHPGPDIPVSAAASLAALPRSGAHRLLAELAGASLITEHTPNRYGCHDLLAAYAADLAREVDSDEQRRAATARMLDHYTHTAHAADRILAPARDPMWLPLTEPAGGSAPVPLADSDAALDWLTAERQVMLALPRLAAAAGFDTHAWQLAWSVDVFLWRRGEWRVLADIWRTAVDAAGRLDSPVAASCAHRLLARTLSLLGRYEEARGHLDHALRLHTGSGDLAGQANTHHALALWYERQDRPRDALEHAKQALASYRAGGNPRGEADALNYIGWSYALLGDHAEALVHCQPALALYQEVGDRDGEAAAWDSLGYAHQHLRHDADAIVCYRQALALRRDLGDRYWKATTLTHLGDIHHAMGDAGAARAAWADALDILTDLDHPQADAVRAKLEAATTR
jgi:DNA-binding SARP family transcriptional activator/tetratricopeptide (TPR) repeat protein